MNIDELDKELTERVLEEAEAFRKTQETAILVMMFIDMAKSTQTREEMGQAPFEILRRQKKQVFTSKIERDQRGRVVKDLGDGLLAVFALPDLAVQTALDIQEVLAPEPSFQVRIGLDMGQVTQETTAGVVKDVFGRHVSRAARIEALCDGGHILTSYTVWDSAQTWLHHRPQVDWKAHGSYRLKGFADPQAVYEPYNKTRTVPLAALSGQKVPETEEVGYCKLCGRAVKFTETFQCRTCGTAWLCAAACFHHATRQCLACVAKQPEQEANMAVKAQELLELHNPQASFPVRIWTERGEQRSSKRNILVVPKKEFGQYNIGDRVTAYFQSATDAYVYIFNIGPTGAVTQIFPNDYTTDNHVNGGKQYTFPAEDAPFEWILQEPAGTETIKVIAVKVPVQIEQFIQARRATAATRNIGVQAKPSPASSLEQWAEASCTLLVQK